MKHGDAGFPESRAEPGEEAAARHGGRVDPHELKAVPQHQLGCRYHGLAEIGL